MRLVVFLLSLALGACASQPGRGVTEPEVLSAAPLERAQEALAHFEFRKAGKLLQEALELAPGDAVALDLKRRVDYLTGASAGVPVSITFSSPEERILHAEREVWLAADLLDPQGELRGLGRCSTRLNLRLRAGEQALRLGQSHVAAEHYERFLEELRWLPGLQPTIVGHEPNAIRAYVAHRLEALQAVRLAILKSEGKHSRR